MIGPEATNSLASADVLVVLLGGVVAASAVAALSAGAAGELLQAALTIISRTIGAILNMTLMEASFYFLTIRTNPKACSKSIFPAGETSPRRPDANRLKLCRVPACRSATCR